MSSIIKNLLKPLPVEQRVTAQAVRPLYHSRVLDTMFGNTLRICQESIKKGTRPSWTFLSYVQAQGSAGSEHVRLARAVPRNDPLRPFSKDARLETVWVLLAYLAELGPVEAPITAAAPFVCGDRVHIAYWGETEKGVGYRLHIIREDTPHQALRALIDSSLLLISEPAE